MSEIEDLQAQYDRVMAEYERVGRPLFDRAIALHQQIMELKREAGLLFYVEYGYSRPGYVEECETLAEAQEHGRAEVNVNAMDVFRIHGPGVDLGEREWEDCQEPS